MDPSILAGRIAALSNSVVRANAQEIFNIAQSSNNTQLFDILDNLLNKSASGDGTAIFYSGRDQSLTSNLSNAEQCRDTLGDDNSYLFDNTEAGQFLEELVLDLALEGLELPSGDLLFNLGSSMMADQAGSNVIAFVDGSANNSTWIQHELTALLENGTSSVNTLDTATLNNSQQDGISLEDISNSLGDLSHCYDDFPPTGGAPVTEPDPELENPDSSWDAATLLTGGAIVGGVVIGAGICLLNPVACAVVVSTVLVTRSASADEAPIPPTSNDAGLNYLYQSELAAYNAAHLAPDIAYMTLVSGVASGQIPASALDGFSGEDVGLETIQSFTETHSEYTFTAEIQGIDGTPTSVEIQPVSGSQTINLLDSSGNLVQNFTSTTNDSVETTTHDPLNLNLWDTTTTVIDVDGNIITNIQNYDFTGFDSHHDLTPLNGALVPASYFTPISFDDLDLSAASVSSVNGGNYGDSLLNKVLFSKLSP